MAEAFCLSLSNYTLKVQDLLPNFASSTMKSSSITHTPQQERHRIFVYSRVDIEVHLEVAYSCNILTLTLRYLLI